MLVVTAVCLVVVVALAVVLVRTRAQVDRLAELARELTDDREDAVADARRAREEGDALRIERDDALERVQRARRDAAEVANRLQEERAARSEAEAAGATATAQCDELQREVAALRDELAVSVPSAAAGSEEQAADAEVLWELALARVSRTWRTSIALLPDEPSPIEGAPDTLRAAVEVLVDAAREEAGADIDLEWSGDSSTIGAHRAVLALSVIEAIIETVAKVVAPTHLHVTVTPRGVELAVTTDEASGSAVPLELPAALATGPGRFLVA
jgi:hypothetical protein